MISIKFCITKNSEPSIFILVLSSEYIKKVKSANTTISSKPLFISNSKNSNNLSIESNQIFKLGYYQKYHYSVMSVAKVPLVRNLFLSIGDFNNEVRKKWS